MDSPLSVLSEPAIRSGCRCCGSGLNEGVLKDVEREQTEARLAKLSVEAQPTAQKPEGLMSTEKPSTVERQEGSEAVSKGLIRAQRLSQYDTKVITAI